MSKVKLVQILVSTIVCIHMRSPNRSAHILRYTFSGFIRLHKVLSTSTLIYKNTLLDAYYIRKTVKFKINIVPDIITKYILYWVAWSPLQSDHIFSLTISWGLDLNLEKWKLPQHQQHMLQSTLRAYKYTATYQLCLYFLCMIKNVLFIWVKTCHAGLSTMLFPFM